MNKAREFFEKHLQSLEARATAHGRDFSEVLSMLLDTPNRFILMAIPPKRRLHVLTGLYRLQFYEWLANTAMADAAAAFTAQKKRSLGGKLRGAQAHNDSIAKKTKIIEKAADLMSKGHARRGLNKAIARETGFETEYVRKVRREWQRAMNADKS